VWLDRIYIIFSNCDTAAPTAVGAVVFRVCLTASTAPYPAGFEVLGKIVKLKSAPLLPEFQDAFGKVYHINGWIFDPELL